MNNFHCFASNKLERLAELFRARIHHRPSADPFVPEVVVVQTQGMAAWLKYLLADDGIAANFDTPFLNNFINHTLAAVFGRDFQNDLRRNAPRVTRWRVYDLLAGRAADFPEATAYIQGETPELKRWQLACRIADFFDQYQIYRPEMIAGWRAGRTLRRYDWQRRMYLELFPAGSGRDCYFARFAALERLPEAVAARVPRRVTLFGAGAMPPEFFRFFLQLAKHCEVNFFYLNPCCEFWSYQYGRRESARHLEAGEEAPAGNPLLAAFGTQGRRFFQMVTDAMPELEEEFEPYLEAERWDPDSYRNPTVLTALQQDIFSMSDRGVHADGELTGHPLPLHDDSVRVHNCHSRQREIEVLHDQLLGLLENPAVQPRHIIVMAPDINAYAPYIDAVFGQGPLAGVYAISDRSLRETGRTVKAFTRLLELTHSKFAASEIFALLDVAGLRQRFELSADDLPVIRNWIANAGIRWGVDAADRQEACAVEFADYSWRQGLDRLLMGFARITPPDRLFDDGIAGLDAAEGGDAVRLGNFITFAERLFAWRTELRRRRPAREWPPVLARLIQEWFAVDADNREEISGMLRVLRELEQQMAEADTEAELPVEVVRDLLEGALEIPGEYEPFLRGKITFCSMVPMRSIPMPVVALLGLNDGEFPRRDLRVGFNLLAVDPQATDRSRQTEDRYLFLEAILSARRHLLLFYQGQSARGDEQSPPAPPLSELLDYLRNAFAFQVTEHRLQPFDFHYFDRNPIGGGSFSSEDFLAARTLADTLRRGRVAPPECLPEPREPEPLTAVTLAELERFFANPCAGFLEYRTGAIFSQRLVPLLEDSEPIEPDALIDYLLKTELGRFKLNELPKDVQYELLRRTCRLPVGERGRQSFEALHRIIDAIPAAWSDRLRRRDKLLLDVQLDDCRITGFVEGEADGSEQWVQNYSKFKYKYAVRFYLRHLLSTLHFRRPVLSRNLSLDGAAPCEWTLEALTPELAASRLRELLAWFRTGRERPLPLFPQASFEFVTGSGDRAARCQAARNRFSSSFLYEPDSADPAIARCFTAECFDDEAVCAEWQYLSHLVLAPFAGPEEER